MSDKLINKVKNKYTRDDIEELDDFEVGDTIRVWSTVSEGEHERLQPFEGIVINESKGGTDATFTVRKLSGDTGVEKIFPKNSPSLAEIEVLKKGEVNQANLYYLRDKIGKKAKVKEKRMGEE